MSFSCAGVVVIPRSLPATADSNSSSALEAVFELDDLNNLSKIALGRVDGVLEHRVVLVGARCLIILWWWLRIQ